MNENGEERDLSYYLRSSHTDQHKSEVSKKKRKKKKKGSNRKKNATENKMDGQTKLALGKRLRENLSDEDKIPRKLTHIREGNSLSTTDDEETNDRDENTDPTANKVSYPIPNDERTKISSENESSAIGSEHLSDYEISENNLIDNSEGFTLVEKRRNHNATGKNYQPRETIDFQKSMTFFINGKAKPNPLLVTIELEDLLKRKNIRILSDNSTVVVEFDNRDEQEALNSITTLGGSTVRAKPPHLPTGELEQVVISGVSTSIDTETIKRLSGCESAFRIEKVTDGVKYPTTAVILTYRKDESPPEIRISYMIYRTRPYIRSPTRCYNCNKYGHVAKHCLRDSRCAICAGGHATRECPNPTQGARKCASCGSMEHTTGNKECPARKRVSEINKKIAIEGITYAQAASKRNVDSKKTQQRQDPLMMLKPKEHENTFSVNKKRDLDRKTIESLEENVNKNTKTLENHRTSITEILLKTKRNAHHDETIKENMNIMNDVIKDLKNKVKNIATKVMEMLDNLDSMVDESAFSCKSKTRKEQIEKYNESSDELEKNNKELREIINSLGTPDPHQRHEQDIQDMTPRTPPATRRAIRSASRESKQKE